MDSYLIDRCNRDNVRLDQAYSQQQYMRSDLYANTPITIFLDDREALSVARDLAEMKTVQGDNCPFFVMDMGRVCDLLESWHSSLPRVQPFYSLRCNSDPVLLHLLAEQPEVGFYCTHRMELEQILELVPPSRVLYANPLWTRGTLRHARNNGVQLLLFENEKELNSIASIFPEAELILRVCMNPSFNETSNRSGCDALLEAPYILGLAADIGLNVVGISFSIGATASSSGIYRHAVLEARRLFDVASDLNHQIRILDIGGGFPGFASPEYLSFQQISNAFNVALDEYFSESDFADLSIVAEPGRYFAASAFSLVTNIISKRSVDASNVTNNDFDAGSEGFVYETNESFFGCFGCILSENCQPQCRPLLEELKDNDSSNFITYATVLGRTHDELDVIQSVIRLPAMQVGQWLLWNGMGAYSMKNEETLGKTDAPAPPIYYFVGNGRWQHVRRAQSDIVDTSMENCKSQMFTDEHDIECQSISSEETESNAVSFDEGNLLLLYSHWLLE